MHAQDRSDFIFRVTTGWPPSSGRNEAFLTIDRWDDFGFKTLFKLYVFDAHGKRHDCGFVKIARFGLRESNTPIKLPGTFPELEDNYFSLGQEEDYYLVLSKLDVTTRDNVLTGLRDVVADQARFEKARHEEAMRVSLLRGTPAVTVQKEYRRVLYGTGSEEAFTFSFVLSDAEGDDTIRFHVRPASIPPTNIHVLIGPNGSGKTHILNAMADEMVGRPRGSARRGAFIPPEEGGATGFAGAVIVSFSAFDEFRLRKQESAVRGGFHYQYVGLRVVDEPHASSPEELSASLTNQFVRSFGTCIVGARRERWLRALQTLETEPGFRQLGLRRQLIDGESGTDQQEDAAHFFRQLSSGHKLVLLTMTRLVEVVRERTLVLLDEPESHLHPPLLSAFVRALSDLLAAQNGVAIVATHSPVVLQEVPKSCVTIISRSGPVSRFRPPALETFGENVSVLTKEVFRLDVTKSGFHRLLEDTIDSTSHASEITDSFGGQLGSEARAIVHGLVAARRERAGE